MGLQKTAHNPAKLEGPCFPSAKLGLSWAVQFKLGIPKEFTMQLIPQEELSPMSQQGLPKKTCKAADPIGKTFLAAQLELSWAI